MNFYIKSANSPLKELKESVIIEENTNSKEKKITLNFPANRFSNMEEKMSNFIIEIEGYNLWKNTIITKYSNYEIYQTFYKIFY